MFMVARSRQARIAGPAVVDDYRPDPTNKSSWTGASRQGVQWTHTCEPTGIKRLAQIQSMAALVTRTQPWEAG